MRKGSFTNINSYVLGEQIPLRVLFLSVEASSQVKCLRACARSLEAGQAVAGG